MDLDDRVAKLKRRAFWVSLLSVIAWRRYVRSKPTTIPKVMTTASLSTLHLGHFLFFFGNVVGETDLFFEVDGYDRNFFVPAWKSKSDP